MKTWKTRDLCAKHLKQRDDEENKRVNGLRIVVKTSAQGVREKKSKKKSWDKTFPKKHFQPDLRLGNTFYCSTFSSP